MIHGTCGTFIPDSDCWFDVVGRTAKVDGYCTTCNHRGFLGSVRLTDNQYAAWYHGVSERWLDLAKRFNHSRMTMILYGQRLEDLIIAEIERLDRQAS